MNLSTMPCILCPEKRLSSRTGEHALPHWLQRRLFPDGDVYTITRDGESLGRAQENFGSIRTPMCTTCNGVLRRNFEPSSERDPRIDAVLDLVRGITDSVPEQYGDWFRLWAVKTWLLLGHPQTGHTHGHLPADQLNPCDPWMFDWMLTDQPTPPPGIAAWVHLQGERPAEARPENIPFDLVTVRRGMNRAARPFVSTMGLQRIVVHLVVQPGPFEVAHPLADSSEVVRLWPGSGAVELRTLPEEPRKRVSWRRFVSVTREADSSPPTRRILGGALDPWSASRLGGAATFGPTRDTA